MRARLFGCFSAGPGRIPCRASVSAVLLTTTMAVLTAPTLLLCTILRVGSRSTTATVQKRLEDWGANITGFRVDIGRLEPNWNSRSVVVSNISIFSNHPGIGSIAIDTVEFTLSLFKYLTGRGIIDTCTISGVRGAVLWDTPPAHAELQKRRHGFAIRDLVLQDLLVTIMRPSNQDKHEARICSATIPLLRRQWLLYDLANATSIAGTFDKSPFVMDTVHFGEGSDGSDAMLVPARRVRIDRLGVAHVKSSAGEPVSWVSDGTMDVIATITIPRKTHVSWFVSAVKALRHRLNGGEGDSIHVRVDVRLCNIQTRPPFYDSNTGVWSGCWGPRCWGSRPGLREYSANNI